MLSTDIPSKFPIPFGNAAGGSYIRAIPEASQIGIQDGAASLTDGFPPLNFLPVAGGGVPPFGQDFNGLLNQITEWIRWTTAGGIGLVYDAAFSTAIGGYPKGAVLQSTATGNFWLSTADNNTADPDGAGTNWVRFIPPEYSGADIGTTNALEVVLTPAPAALIDGMRVWVRAANTITGAATLKADGVASPAAISIKTLGGSDPAAGMILAGYRTLFIYDQTSNVWVISSPFAPTQSFVPICNVALAAIGSLSWSADSAYPLSISSQSFMAATISGSTSLVLPAGKYILVMEDTETMNNVTAATQAAVVMRVKKNGTEIADDLETTYLLSGQNLTVSHNFTIIVTVNGTDTLEFDAYLSTTSSGDYSSGSAAGGSVTALRIGN